MHTWRTLPDGRTEVDGSAPTLRPSEAEALRQILSKHGDIIAAAASRTGAPIERILAHEWIESGGAYPTPRGSSGEYGPMQIMPFHFEARKIPEARRGDLETNIGVGAELIAEIAREGADAPTAASIYNAGGNAKAPTRDPSSPWGLRATGDYIDRFVRATNFLLSDPAEQARISSRAKTVGPITVLVAGDSIAAGVGAYVATALGRRARVVTAGVTGARTSAIDAALASAIASVGGPVDVIALVAGTNDEGYPDVQAARDAYWSLALHAAERAREGVVLVALPPNQNPAAAPYAWRAEDLNWWMRACAKQLARFRFRAIAVDGQLGAEDMDRNGSPPGVHPIARGYAKMASAIARGVEELGAWRRYAGEARSSAVVVLALGAVIGRYLHWW